MKHRQFIFTKNDRQITDTLVSINDGYVIGLKYNVPRNKVKDFIELTPFNSNFHYQNKEEIINVLVKKLHSPELIESISEQVFEDLGDREGIGVAMLSNEPIRLENPNLKELKTFPIDEDLKLIVLDYVKDKN